MNILLLTTYPYGGAGIACRRLQAALNESGETANLLTGEKLPGKWPFYAERISFLPFERDKTVRFAFSLANFGHDISRHPAVQKADVLHLHWINQGFLSLQNIRQLANLGKPIVWTLHDMWAFTGGCHYSGNCLNYLQACGNCPCLKRPAAHDLSHRIWMRKQSAFPEHLRFVACSEWLADTARSSGLLRNASVVAIPNPIDTNVFAPGASAERKMFKRQYGIAENSLLVLFAAVNAREERKGFRYLREALQQLKSGYPEMDVTLMVLGKCDTAELAALPYPSHPLGMVTDVAQLASVYGAADIFVIPSLEDNLPNTVMEALSCGTPVVGFQTGGIPEMVDHQINGFIAPQRNSAALSEGIRWIYEAGVAGTENLRLAARQKVMQCYANAVVAKRYQTLYRESLG